MPWVGTRSEVSNKSKSTYQDVEDMSRISRSRLIKTLDSLKVSRAGLTGACWQSRRGLRVDDWLIWTRTSISNISIVDVDRRPCHFLKSLDTSVPSLDVSMSSLEAPFRSPSYVFKAIPLHDRNVGNLMWPPCVAYLSSMTDKSICDIWISRISRYKSTFRTFNRALSWNAK